MKRKKICLKRNKEETKKKKRNLEIINAKQRKNNKFKFILQKWI